MFSCYFVFRRNISVSLPNTTKLSQHSSPVLLHNISLQWNVMSVIFQWSMLEFLCCLISRLPVKAPSVCKSRIATVWFPFSPTLLYGSGGM